MKTLLLCLSILGFSSHAVAADNVDALFWNFDVEPISGMDASKLEKIGCKATIKETELLELLAPVPAREGALFERRNLRFSGKVGSGFLFVDRHGLAELEGKMYRIEPSELESKLKILECPMWRAPSVQ